ncbi:MULTISPECIES: 1-deoxy-D-xylulose-5-phosphate synthase [unclassified Methylophaga]|jgi:1-deoxy-D-xylulose-5-phosphate synthase|uniref:1-deoxy-D-xylulose-5-phosphate synthase n=2 Tax=Methylophaga TaxID=40222 RepID=UPI000C5531E0|nr:MULTISPECIES: 1-deoxy-D-xylulose-5-phosphate synthase [unclassified Methylophaga]MAL48358.1 1-deoxy-D-xylulose-5-phosphate synthase [Methylophaga sp.]MBP24447.1 1-deoxy-D-xylulose-5-phosphate synthase [Methylophaga sp.]HCC81834.1 1-deoxy-D-xylulose-5-phosphate synthase [Methylophaga sp.]|tara:strand:+ start:2095 stop:3918 length:1824 start_codon:yes stop_codon:yes gene_type:complete
MTSLLAQIDSPAQLRQLERKQLDQLAIEIRELIIDQIQQTGGHISSNLGVVELTLALHYVFNTPEDHLVWDVGHQSYAHKILTGRRDQLHTMRQPGGLSGFPKRSESDYDSFGVGHSSTSISAALGMAIAARASGLPSRSVAIIGDGALTAGQAYEALAHAGDLNADMLVVLNDNEMSISKNVGGMANYLARLLSGRFYRSARESSKKMLEKIPPAWEFARRTEEHVKGMMVPGTLFEEMGFNYIGPIDGHDLDTLITTLSNLRNSKGAQFLHIVTKKGKGFEPAEQQPCKYHGVSPANSNKKSGPTFTQVFSQWLCDMGTASEDLIAITPAMCEGSGLNAFAERFPERYFDVGIAEQHAVTLAAGIACEGKKPVVAIYSTFLQRAYDQLIHDVALQNLPVLFAIDRAGLVGADGPTHAGSFDLSYLRCIPNMLIMTPSDENECRQMLTTGYHHNGPAAVRYPRGCGNGTAIEPQLNSLPICKAQTRRTGKKTAILAFGTLLHAALDAAEQIDATVVNMRFVKPLDTTLLDEIAASHELIITIEENALMGGAGSAVNEYFQQQGIETNLRMMGLPDHFIEHGDHGQMLSACGLDASGIIDTINRYFA